jgi:hypothetical protein
MDAIDQLKQDVREGRIDVDRLIDPLPFSAPFSLTRPRLALQISSDF